MIRHGIFYTTLSAADTTLMTAQWIGTPSTASIQKIEVFAIDDVERFFFEQKIISGFATVNNSKKYMRIYFNETASPVRLNLRCADGKELTIFEATTRCTGTAEAVKELIDRC